MITKWLITGIIILLGISLPEIKAQTNEKMGTVIDIDGNIYKTITIGKQVWMAENLKTIRYSNGDIIGTTCPDTLDYRPESEPKYQWAYNGNESNALIYGRLYTWYVVIDSRNVCPGGWHVPTDNEWEILIGYLGGEIAARGKLKEKGLAHWESPNSDATNESGFSALPSGSRWPEGSFVQLGYYTHFWSASERTNNKSYAYRRLLTFDGNNYECCHAKKTIGWSVRCLKD